MIVEVWAKDDLTIDKPTERIEEVRQVMIGIAGHQYLIGGGGNGLIIHTGDRYTQLKLFPDTNNQIALESF